jgi:hypothetical protein
LSQWTGLDYLIKRKLKFFKTVVLSFYRLLQSLSIFMLNPFEFFAFIMNVTTNGAAKHILSFNIMHQEGALQ